MRNNEIFRLSFHYYLYICTNMTHEETDKIIKQLESYLKDKSNPSDFWYIGIIDYGSKLFEKEHGFEQHNTRWMTCNTTDHQTAKMIKNKILNDVSMDLDIYLIDYDKKIINNEKKNIHSFTGWLNILNNKNYCTVYIYRKPE